jgi:hypothetical protein
MASMRWGLKLNYGITVQEYEAKLVAQEGKCAICRCSDSGKKGWHVDHDHDTGKFRGLLCMNCNTGLGKFRDDPDLVRAALQYLS